MEKLNQFEHLTECENRAEWFWREYTNQLQVVEPHYNKLKQKQRYYFKQMMSARIQISKLKGE